MTKKLTTLFIGIFWHMNIFSQSPIIAKRSCTFIYSGKADSVAIAGDFNSWNPTNGKMEFDSYENIWKRKVSLDKAARVEYKIVIDGEWVKDPQNPFTAPGEHNNSEVKMPNYKASPFLKEKAIPKGELMVFPIQSNQFKEDRNVTFYVPNGFSFPDEKSDSNQEYNLAIFNDGKSYLDAGNMKTILDNLIHEGFIPPTVVAFVTPEKRTDEYQGKDKSKYTEFIAVELIDFIQQYFSISSQKEQRAIIGSSLGGNISLWIGTQYPNQFGNIGALSPFVDSDLEPYFSSPKDSHPKIFVLHSKYDHLEKINTSVELLIQKLKKNNFDYKYLYRPENHSYGFWRNNMHEALIYFFGSTSK